LVLGAQVLLGFQYRAFFEKGYEKLGPAERALELGALLALLFTLGALFLPPARHRIVERGRDTARFHHFTMTVMRVVLLPFAVGLSFDLAIAGNRIAGPWAGAASGAIAFVAALALWYGHFFRTDRQEEEEPEDAVEDTPLEHRIVEVLTETRILLPGVQALLGFQLAMVLMETFPQLSRGVQLVHLVSLGFVALATIVLMSPPAYHRIVERGRVTERFPEGQTCCGQPMANSGFFDDARPLARKMLDVFAPYEHVVCPSGSCTSMVRNHFETLLPGDPGVAGLRAKTRELCEFLHDVLQVKPRGRFPHKVGLHESCHGLRELRLGSGSERLVPPFSKTVALLEGIEGLRLTELARADECCGFGGTFAVTEEAVSCAMG